ncbi:MAG: nicotinate-nucleotide diphosphorylase (carboxylating) [Alphaproteobacteria bacterium]|nr:nicotinate-nucleotide diphosphorylase (carboxylating) [Alphaproteobacteria bacterium]|tara:strand:- start:5244 stop:6107 length:864 start_codon:yes stop_codon:yes gene_type:complete
MATPVSSPSALLIEKIVRSALEEDLGPQMQDITSNLTVPANRDIIAKICAREDGTLAGLIAGLSAFTIIDPELEITLHVHEGDTISAGQTIATIEGNARSIMMAERVCLNILGHLSGIATLTARYVEAIAGTTATICDTRKTLPGLRALQKYAVTCGGGNNHRFGLYDAIMIKDNHIAASGGIEDALNNASLLRSHTVKIEIEVDTLDQLQTVINHGGADIVLLDNMNAQQLTQAVDMIGDAPLISEASGGVSLETVAAIAQSGVNMISIGALTHSAPNFDFGLDIE